MYGMNLSCGQSTGFWEDVRQGMASSSSVGQTSRCKLWLCGVLSLSLSKAVRLNDWIGRCYALLWVAAQHWPCLLVTICFGMLPHPTAISDKYCMDDDHPVALSGWTDLGVQVWLGCTPGLCLVCCAYTLYHTSVMSCISWCRSSCCLAFPFVRVAAVTASSQNDLPFSCQQHNG